MWRPSANGAGVVEYRGEQFLEKNKRRSRESETNGAGTERRRLANVVVGDYNKGNINNNQGETRADEKKVEMPILGLAGLLCCAIAIILSAVLSGFWYHYTWILTSMSLIVTVVSMTRQDKSRMRALINALSLVLGLVSILWCSVEIGTCMHFCACQFWSDKKMMFYMMLRKELRHNGNTDYGSCCFPIFPPIPVKDKHTKNLTECYSNPVTLTHYAIYEGVSVKSCGDLYDIPDICSTREWFAKRDEWALTDKWAWKGASPLFSGGGGKKGGVGKKKN